MEIIKAVPGERICIGRRGEHLARQVQFSLRTWVEMYGEGSAELLYQRPGDQYAYPIVAERQDDLLLWTITNTDTAQAGEGRCEIHYSVGEAQAISEMSYILIESTLENPGEVPEPPGAAWFELVVEQVRRTAPQVNQETGTWMVYDPEEEEHIDTGIAAIGPQGEEGAAGPKGITPHIGENGNWWIGDTDTGVAAVGANGKNGVGIEKIETTSSTEDSRYNSVKIYLTDGSQKTLLVKNGSKGSSGEKGDPGVQGPKGEKGDAGPAGADGKDGSDANVTADNITEALGYTPVDGAELTLGVKDGLIYIFVGGVAVGNGIEQGVSGDVVGYIDADNNIVLTGTVPEGATYSVKYEMGDGTTIDIGELSLEEAVEVVINNQIPLSIGSDGNPFNGGQGYKTGYRLSGSSGGESAQTGTEVTGFFPVKKGDVIYIKNIVDDSSHVIATYSSTFGYLSGFSFGNVFGGAVNGEIAQFTLDGKTVSWGGNDGTKWDALAYMRVSATEITADSIITVNQPIV